VYAKVWDDASLNDLQLISLLKKYKAKATFGIDSGDLANERMGSSRNAVEVSKSHAKRVVMK